MRRFSDYEHVIEPMQVEPGEHFAQDGPPLHVAHICIWGFFAEMLLAGSCVVVLAGAAIRAAASAI